MIGDDCVSYIPSFVELNISFRYSFIIVSQSWRAISHITYSKYPGIGSPKPLPFCSCLEVFCSIVTLRLTYSSVTKRFYKEAKESGELRRLLTTRLVIVFNLRFL